MAGNYLYLDQMKVGAAKASTNLLDADTATAENTTGHWAPWFSSNIAQSTTQAHSGTRGLQVNITAPYGWGVQLNNWPGFAAGPGPQTIGFWAQAAGGTGTLNATMTVQWRDTNRNLLQGDTTTLAALTNNWQQTTANLTAPAGTATVNVTITGTTGVTGNSLYLDDIQIGN